MNFAEVEVPAVSICLSGLRSLQLVAALQEVTVDPARLTHHFDLDLEGGLSEQDLLRCAKFVGLKARSVRTSTKNLEKTPLPAIFEQKNGEYAVLARVDETRVLIQRTHRNSPEIFTKDQFEDLWCGRLVLVTSRATIIGQLAKFDFSWFIPTMIRYRALLGQVVLASVFLQLFALIMPLLFQVVMDKVLAHDSYSTLNVIAVALVATICFEGVFGYLRTYLLAHTTSRVDVELGAKLFRHMLSLPLSYFEVRRVGDTVARARELDNVREFLTGPALTSILDVVFSVVFLVVMFFYSVKLALLVLCSLPIYALITIIASPALRLKVEESFNRGAESQSFLVEAVGGVETIKALAVEPQLVKRWDNLLASYLHTLFDLKNMAALARGAIELVSKLLGVGIIWFGAKEVMEGQMTLGQLIAFNMLSNNVSAPILRLTQLWQDLQRTGVAVDRVGDLLNAQPEVQASVRADLPPIQGRVDFEHVSFRYRPDGPEILNDISFSIQSGQVIGIAGASGCGKSTIAKLIQRLHVPEKGRVLIDGVDVRLAEPAWLRRQLGVVLQENQLFRRSIRDNIAIGTPSVALDKVIEAARLAAAHDFIIELPQQYDTLIEEQGSNLSGGQRQRLAIARALISSPRLLIFDEATSALDYESESAIMKNMRHICEGRTVILIAHRLSTIRHADLILVMDRGRVAERGTHEDLLALGGIYSHLNSLQESFSL